MSNFPDTDIPLILRLRGANDQAAWVEFERLYRPVIFRVATSRGCQHADALDIVQLVLLSVASAIHKYELHREGASFRSWLRTITRNAILKALTRGPRDKAIGGTKCVDVLSQVPEPDMVVDSAIAKEYRHEVYRYAADRVKNDVQESTWLSFEMTVLGNHSVQDAAEILGVTAGCVYTARSRVLNRLRSIIREVE